MTASRLVGDAQRVPDPQPGRPGRTAPAADLPDLPDHVPTFPSEGDAL